MKATLEFNLPEEQDKYRITVHAEDWYSVVLDFVQDLRGEIKYGEEYDPKTVEWVRNLIYKIMDEHGVQLD